MVKGRRGIPQRRLPVRPGSIYSSNSTNQRKQSKCKENFQEAKKERRENVLSRSLSEVFYLENYVQV